MTVLILSKSVTNTIIMMTLAGAANPGRLTVGYIYASEFLAPEWQVFFGTAFNFMDGAIAPILALYFDFIDNHYIIPVLIGLCLSCLAVLLVIFLMYESPLWQLKMGKIEQA